MTIKTELNHPGVTMWGGMSSDGVMGLDSFDTTLDGNNYLNMLCSVVVPQLATGANFTALTGRHVHPT